MSGGFLSQSVAMPEIDGGIRSFALFAQYKDKEGYQHSFAVPERLETFVETVKNYLALKTKPNSEKRVANVGMFKERGCQHGGFVIAIQQVLESLKFIKDDQIGLKCGKAH